MKNFTGQPGCRAGPVGCSVSQVQDESTKEEDGVPACRPIRFRAERRRSLWYATHYPTEERKVRHKERNLHFLLYFAVFILYCWIWVIWYYIQTQTAQFIEMVWFEVLVPESFIQEGNPVLPKETPWLHHTLQDTILYFSVFYWNLLILKKMFLVF